MYSNFGYDNVIEHINSEGNTPLVEGQNFHKHNLSYMTEWWKVKAQKRYEKLVEENRLRHELEIYTLERIENNEVDMVR